MVKEVHQCSSCGGFCKKSGCERANEEPTPTISDYEKLRVENAAVMRNNKELLDQRFELMEQVGKLNAENARLRKLLDDCQYALDYAADMTKPEGLSGCDCPICTTTIALHKELRKKS